MKKKRHKPTIKKKAVNLSLTLGVLRFADQVMEARANASMSTFVEELIRNKYEEMTGPIRIKPMEGEPSANPGRVGDPPGDSNLKNQTAAALFQVVEAKTRARAKARQGKPGPIAQHPQTPPPKPPAPKD